MILLLLPLRTRTIFLVSQDHWYSDAYLFLYISMITILLKFGQTILTRTSLQFCLFYSFFRLNTPVCRSNASVNSTWAQPPPAPPPPGWLPGISIFALDGKFLGVRPLELPNPTGRGRKKRANAPSSVNTATFFHWSHHIDRHIDLRFFVSINVFPCNSARILIKTSRRDDMHPFMVLVLI